MDLNFGINGSIKTEAATPITVKSTTVIGIAGIATGNHGLHKFNNAEAAEEFLETEKITGVLVNSLKGIALQGVNCPIVLNLAQANGLLNALDLFKKSEGLTGLSMKGGLLLAPELSATAATGARLDAVAASLWATALIDSTAQTEAAVTNWAKNYGSKSALLTHGSYTADGVSVPASALFAGVIAHWDAKPYGWAKSHSNRVVKGVSAAQRVVEYLDSGECEARRMRQKGVAMIVRDVGWRTYGFETTHIDTVWQSLDRVRTFYRLLMSIMKASKWARDREANELLRVKQSVVDFMNELKGNDVIIGFDVEFDPKKNTKASVTAGKFYLTIRVGDMPSVRELNIELVHSDNWNNALINYLNQEQKT